MILTEGAAGNHTVWRNIHHIPFVMLRRRWQATLLDLLHKKLGSNFTPLNPNFLVLTIKDCII